MSDVLRGTMPPTLWHMYSTRTGIDSSLMPRMSLTLRTVRDELLRQR